ncbi:uncharacterized protein LOC141695964 [Apium graveolens]|uniref:uncharacterized protein LOC141695964 n=1 Tax=Apium graveolens TaxID=4045 RepID=UPI003D7AE026
MLDENNQLAEGFRYGHDRINLGETDDFSLLLVSSKSASGRKNQVGPSNEVASLVVGDSDDTCPFRDIVVQTKQMYLKRIYVTCKHFMQLQYPLLFPYGDDDFHLDIPLHNKKPKVPDENVSDLHPDETQHKTTVTMREYYAYNLMIRPEEGMNLHLGGRLWQQFVVDAFAAVEQYRLDWTRAHQNIIRSDLYKSIRDSISKGDTNPSTKGKNVILPATHTGSQRYMNQYFKDSLAICRTIDHPSLFLTMTCNTQWPEIKIMMKFFPGVDVADKLDVSARVFKLKLDQLLDLFKNKNYFGKCIGVMHVIEFQKRGLPHCHMLIWLHPRGRQQNIDDINQLISTEIPDKNHNPIGFNVVNSHMIHGHMEKITPTLLAWLRAIVVAIFLKGVDFFIYGICIGICLISLFNAHTFFDDCGFPVYRRRHTGLTVTKKGVELDNQYVVPYNRDLLVRFHCHINLEVCNKFDIHHRFPTVERLSVHLEGEKSVSFEQHENLQDVAEKAKKRFSKLEGWFQANKNIPEARQFTYHQFPHNFTWKQDQNMWKIRERGTVFGRLSDVHASSGETFYLHMILMHIKGATSFKDLRTVNGIMYNTYNEACDALGLLKDDKQWDVAMTENSNHAMPFQMRQLFVFILSNNQVTDPLKLWQQHWKAMVNDVLYSRRKISGNVNLQLSESDIQNITLIALVNNEIAAFKDYHKMMDFIRSCKLNYATLESLVIYYEVVEDIWTTSVYNSQDKTITFTLKCNNYCINSDVIRACFQLPENNTLVPHTDTDVSSMLISMGYSFEPAKLANFVSENLSIENPINKLDCWAQEKRFIPDLNRADNLSEVPLIYLPIMERPQVSEVNTSVSATSPPQVSLQTTVAMASVSFPQQIPTQATKTKFSKSKSQRPHSSSSQKGLVSKTT